MQTSKLLTPLFHSRWFVMRAFLGDAPALGGKLTRAPDADGYTILVDAGGFNTGVSFSSPLLPYAPRQLRVELWASQSHRRGKSQRFFQRCRAQ